MSTANIRRLIFALIIMASLNGAAALVLLYLEVWVDPRFGRTVFNHGFIAVVVYCLAAFVTAIAVSDNRL